MNSDQHVVLTFFMGFFLGAAGAALSQALFVLIREWSKDEYARIGKAVLKWVDDNAILDDYISGLHEVIEKARKE